MFGPARPLRGGGNFNTPLEEEIHELREAQEIQHQEYENQVNFWFFRIDFYQFLDPLNAQIHDV